MLQRFGSALKLNVHGHVVFIREPEEIGKILAHLALPETARDFACARAPPWDDLGATDSPADVDADEPR